MADPGMLTGLDAINDAVDKLQASARRTIPMFLVGILATLIAAGVALFYIMTLSADLREARGALRQSQAALMQARANLAAANVSLRQAQKTVTSPADAGSIAAAISEVSRSQSNITVASTSIKDATAKLNPEIGERAESPPRQIAGSCRLKVNSVTYLQGNCEIELARGGSFRIYTVGRSGPSAYVRREGPVGIGSWQSAPSQEPVALGELQRSGACWSNGTASICAWNTR